jgi:hypothetical protein
LNEKRAKLLILRQEDEASNAGKHPELKAHLEEKEFLQGLACFRFDQRGAFEGRQAPASLRPD